MRSLAPTRMREDNAMLGNRDAVIDDASASVIGILTNSGYMREDFRVRGMATKLLREEFERMPTDVRQDPEATAKYVADAIQRTSATIVDTARDFASYRDAEASLAIVQVLDDPTTGEAAHAIIAVSGTNRVFRYRTRGLEPLTEPQTDARGKPNGGLGRPGGRPPIVLDEDARPGDVFLICSEDILAGMRDDDILRACTAERGDPARVSDAIVRAARQRGIGGSLSAVAVRIPEANARA